MLGASDLGFDARSSFELEPVPFTSDQEQIRVPRRRSPHTSWSQMLRRMGVALLPSFLHGFAGGIHDVDESVASNTSSFRQNTNFLDGMRGVAAFFVFVEHFLLPFWGNMFFAYGGEYNATIFQLPIVRLLYSGSPMVSIFFVISGIALSLKPARLVEKGDWDSLYWSLESMVFRRSIRLFGPCLLLSLTFMVLAVLGMCDAQSSVPWEGSNAVRDSFWNLQPKSMGNVWAQMGDWAEFLFIKVLIPMTWRGTGWRGATAGMDFRDPKDATQEYGTQLWTVAVEYWASLLLFITLLGTIRFCFVVRVLIFSVLIMFSLRVGRWDMALFLFGSSIATTSPFQTWDPKETRPIWKKVSWFCMLLAGLFIASYPVLGGSITPGFTWLADIADNYRYWHSAGAAIIVPCVANLNILRRLFSCSLLQYFGRISFALYLIHLPLLSTLGWRLVPEVWSFVGRDSWLQETGGLVVSMLLILPLVIWLADLFHRFVDNPCTSFSRKVEDYLRVQDI